MPENNIYDLIILTESIFMKKLFLLIIFSALFLLTACTEELETKTDILEAAKTRGKFFVGVSSDCKPFCYIDNNNKFVGLEVDIAKRIAKKILGSEDAVHFIDVRSSDLFSKINKNETDFSMAAITITPQRRMIVDFSDSYFTAGQAIIVKKNSSIKKIKDLNKKKIIVTLGSTGEQIPKKFAPAAILLGYKNNDLAYEALLSGKGDALVSDDVFLKDFITVHKDYKLLPYRLTVEQYGIAFKNTEEASALKSEINNCLREMRTDGTLKELRKKWKTG